MDADTLFREGRLSEAIDALNQSLREDPTNLKSRLFLRVALPLTKVVREEEE